MDSGTAHGYPMHVCNSTFATEAMFSIYVDHNWLICAKDPQL